MPLLHAPDSENSARVMFSTNTLWTSHISIVQNNPVKLVSQLKGLNSACWILVVVLFSSFEQDHVRSHFISH